jgi:hypothetical protein
MLKFEYVWKSDVTSARCPPVPTSLPPTCGQQIVTVRVLNIGDLSAPVIHRKETPYLRTERIILKCSRSSFGWKWDNAESRFSICCCIISAHFFRSDLVADVRSQNAFCSKPHLNCSWFPNFKHRFAITGVDAHSTPYHPGDEFLDLCWIWGSYSGDYEKHRPSCEEQPLLLYWHG